MAEYESNSHKSRETPKAEKVVTGEIVKRKRNGVQRFADSLISGGIENVKELIWEDVIIPKAKDMISDMVRRIAEGACDGVDAALYGRKGRRGEVTTVSYHSCYGKRKDSGKAACRYGFDYEDISFKSRGDAERVLDEMRARLKRYGSVSVADFYGFTDDETTVEYTDYDYGWTDLGKANVARVREGFIIDLPKAVHLD